MADGPRLKACGVVGARSEHNRENRRVTDLVKHSAALTSRACTARAIHAAECLTRSVTRRFSRLCLERAVCAMPAGASRRPSLLIFWLELAAEGLIPRARSGEG